jgi:hypothetical protein
MEDINLKEIWKAYSQEIEQAKILNLQAWAVNLKIFEHLQLHKAQSRLRPLARLKVWGVLLGFLWAFFLGVLVYGNHFKNVYFSTSVSMILLFTMLAIALYIKHIVLINQINQSDNLVQVQEKLAGLQASSINTARILWLQMPFYTSFFWSSRWMATDIKFWLIAFPVTLGFTALAIWLFCNITYRNAHKRWFRLLLSGSEWAPVLRAIDYLKEIEDFKQG